jgi:branched-chain amino acid transport system substrate-binding protein
MTMPTLQALALTAAAAVAAICAGPALAQEAYVVGLTGDLSGPASGTYKPMADAVRVYFDNVNAKGGINGRPVKLITRDSRSDPNTVVTDLNFFDSEGVVTMVFVSPSGTLGAYVKQNAASKIPTIYVNACYPPATPPQADPNFFCPGISTLTDSLAAVDLIQRLMGQEKIKLAFVTTDIPGARGAAEKIMKPYAEQKGIEVATVAVMPVGTTDASTIARGFVSSGVNAVISYTITSHMLAGAEALAKLEWKGKYLLATGLPGALNQLNQLKSENIYGFDHFSLISEDKPIHKEIKAAAQKFGYDFPLSDIRLGYRSAMVLGEALKRCGWPCDRNKLREVLNNLTVDYQDLLDLNLDPVIFTHTNHTSPKKSYRVYHWSAKERAVTVATEGYSAQERDWK